MDELRIIYDLVKETRDNVQRIDEKLNAHILSTSEKLTEAKAPQTFLVQLKGVALWAGAMGGMYAFIASIFSHPKP
jgi:hypothetical protein